ncbi:transposase family protein [Cyanobacteria bacterium FACHB-63]|nr:transposase family protein [Cyanobacteria bacterium FACHB-63]
MELLQHLLPSQSQLRLETGSLDTVRKHFSLVVTSVQTNSHCPICQNASHRIHSRYQRTLEDLPCSNYAVTLVLQARKFFCINPACQRRIFTERLPQVTEPWARRTCRFAERLIAIGLALLRCRRQPS